MGAGNLQILAYEDSPLGPLCLRRRELLSKPGTVVTEITLNHEFLMGSYHTESERALAERALAFHQQSVRKSGLQVLIGGLGLGYTAQTVLDSSQVERVDVMEFLPQVIDWMRSGLLPLSETLNADSRFRPMLGDVYACLAEGVGSPSAAYDLILIDVDHSPDERLGSGSQDFYSAAGLARAKSHLAAGGVLGVWSYAESSAFSRALHDVFDEVQVVPVRFMNQLVGGEEEDWLFFAK